MTQGAKNWSKVCEIIPRTVPPWVRGAGAPRAKIIFRRFWKKSARSIMVVSLHARTLLLSSATCASLPLRPVEQWEHSGLQLRRSTVQIPSDTNFVFALFNLFSRNQCVALQQRSLVHIQWLQINFCANYSTPGGLIGGVGGD